MARPENLTARLLQIQHKIDGPLDNGPHCFQVAEVAEVQIVMPYPGGNVGDDIGIESVLLHLVFQVVLMPGTVASLAVDEPLVGSLGFASVTTDHECHCRLNVVPRIGVTAGEPGDHA